MQLTALPRIADARPKRHAVLWLAAATCCLGSANAANDASAETEADAEAPSNVEVASGIHVYQDHRLTVVAPAALITATTASDDTFTASYTADIISGATQTLSADVVSSATQFEDVRHQGTVAADFSLSPQQRLGGGYTLSYEPDHVAHVPSVSYSTEQWNRRILASLTYSLTLEDFGRVDDPSMSEHSTSHQVDVAADTIVSPNTVVTALATAFLSECDPTLGCQSNPYRYVAVGVLEPGHAPARIALPERHPDRRAGGAGGLRIAYAMGQQWALHAGYRYYLDNWDIDGHTGSLSVAFEAFSRQLELRLGTRATVQNAASFYRSSYEATPYAPDELPAFRTADAELSALWNASLAARVEWTFPDAGPVQDLKISAQISHLWQRYPNFPSVPERDAWVGGLGLGGDL